MVKTVAGLSVVIGCGANSQNMLVNSNQRTLMVGFGSSKPTFFVSRSSAYNKTGRIGIGDMTDPQVKLHIKADNEEDASLFVEPHRWDEHAQANMLLGNIYHGITADGTAGLVFRTQSAYIFNEGNVGIGTSENLPETKLDVAGTVKMTGLRLQSQGAQAGRVLTCSGLNGQATWQDPSGFSVWSVNERNEAYRMSKVGIGVENPEEMLDVAGNILVNDAIIGKIAQSDWVDPDFLTILGSVNANASKIMIPKGNNLDHLSLKIINPALNGDIQFHTGGHYNAVLRYDEFIVGFPDRYVDLKVNGKIWSHEVEVHSNESSIINVTASGNHDASVWVKNGLNAYGLGINANGKGYIYEDIINPDPLMTFYDGKVGIGADPVQGGVHKLYVSGGITSEEVIVKLQTNWSDFVFDKSYKLQSLKELEQYIEKNKHLPGIPSEEEVKENGINLGEMNALLLKKIEELTLYILEQEKRINLLENRNKQLECK